MLIVKDEMLANIMNDAGSKKLTIDKITKLINDGIVDNLKVSRSTIYRRVKWNNLLRFKKPQLRDQSISKNLSVIRSKFLLRHLLKLMVADFTFVYVDESSFGNRDNVPQQWVMGDNQVVVKKNMALRNVNLILAVSSEGIVHNEVHFSATNTVDFLGFIKRCINKLNSHYFHNSQTAKNFAFVLDNCSMNRSKRVYYEIMQAGFEVAYLSPYAPELNAVEIFFATLKKRQEV